MFCVGWNYLENCEEGAKARPHVQEMPLHPAFFTKESTTVNGPYDPVPAHAGVTEKLDWEVELAVIIGKGGINISEADAMKHIFGYTVANDVSAREIQRQHGQQWFKGKSLDGHCPMGPWIATADEVKEPQNLRITCRVNGVTKQDSNTSYMYFKIPRIIAELSAGLTLEPGDIILSGTPGRHARTPPEFMRAGDVLETESSVWTAAQQHRRPVRVQRAINSAETIRRDKSAPYGDGDGYGSPALRRSGSDCEPGCSDG